MTDERMNEITQYAQERLRTGDILAAYALEVINFAHEAVEARHQAGHSAAELMKLLSQAEKERDEAHASLVILKQEYRPTHEIRAQLLAEMEAHAETRNEVERMRDIVTVNDRRLAAVWDEARAEVERLKLALKTAKQRLNNMDSGEDVYWVES